MNSLCLTLALFWRRAQFLVIRLISLIIICIVFLLPLKLAIAIYKWGCNWVGKIIWTALIIWWHPTRILHNTRTRSWRTACVGRHRNLILRRVQNIWCSIYRLLLGDITHLIILLVVRKTRTAWHDWLLSKRRAFVNRFSVITRKAFV